LYKDYIPIVILTLCLTPKKPISKLNSSELIPVLSMKSMAGEKYVKDTTKPEKQI